MGALEGRAECRGDRSGPGQEVPALYTWCSEPLAVSFRPVGTGSLTEREEISRGLASGSSMRSIAFCLSRAPSTISREVNRHGGRESYRAQKADECAWALGRRPKKCLLAVNRRLREVVEGKLGEQWSSRQISGWLARHYPDDWTMRVSHETISPLSTAPYSSRVKAL